MDEVIDDKEQAINKGDEKQDLDLPGKSQFELCFGEFFFDFRVFFQGKLLGFAGT